MPFYNEKMKLAQLGFSSWYKEKSKGMLKEGLFLARISAVDKGYFMIMGEQGELKAQVTGKFRHDTRINDEHFPTVGDWVYVEYVNNNTSASIDIVMPRKTLLKRKIAGKQVEYQLIGANIDTVCIMQSLDENFNIRRLERYLTAIYENEIEPLIFLSKLDVMSLEKMQKHVSDIKQHYPESRVFPFSNVSGEGLGDIENIFKPAQTYCLVGSSGVGKTTLINKLLGEERYATKKVRERDHQGRHATTRRQLIVLKNGALMIDSPGIREWGSIAIETGIQESFADIEKFSKDCRFGNCSHTQEPGCAILLAIKNQTLNPKRLQSYLKLHKEANGHAKSYKEKKKY
jgi:ribosome biogenesis GTPase